MSIVVETSKKCSTCGFWFALDDFAVDSSRRDGRKPWCRGCDNAKSRAYYTANRKKVLERANERARAKAKRRFCRVCDAATWNQHSPYCEKHSLEALDRRVKRRHRRNMTPAELARARDRERARRRYRPEHNARYGVVHHRTRAEVRKMVEAGMAVCWRCRKPIRPDEPWDLGHVDGSATQYAGPEHRACNRATARRDRRRAA